MKKKSVCIDIVTLTGYQISIHKMRIRTYTLNIRFLPLTSITQVIVL